MKVATNIIILAGISVQILLGNDLTGMDTKLIEMEPAQWSFGIGLFPQSGAYFVDRNNIYEHKRIKTGLSLERHKPGEPLSKIGMLSLEMELDNTNEIRFYSFLAYASRSFTTDLVSIPLLGLGFVNPNLGFTRGVGFYRHFFKEIPLSGSGSKSITFNSINSILPVAQHREKAAFTVMMDQTLTYSYSNTDIGFEIVAIFTKSLVGNGSYLFVSPKLRVGYTFNRQ